MPILLVVDGEHFPEIVFLQISSELRPMSMPSVICLFSLPGLPVDAVDLPEHCAIHSGQGGIATPTLNIGLVGMDATMKLLHTMWDAVATTWEGEERSTEVMD